MANPTSTGASAPVTAQHPFTLYRPDGYIFNVSQGVPINVALEHAQLFLIAIRDTCQFVADDSDDGKDSVLYGTAQLADATLAILTAAVSGLVMGKTDDSA